MPRILVAGFVALLLAGCSTARAQESTTASTAPVQPSAPSSVMPVPQAAPAIADGLTAAAPAVRVSLPPPTDPPRQYAEGSPCSEWWHLAQDVGWPVDQLPTMARVMRCESQCRSGAHNASGASGLMQVMPGWWQGRDPYDPETNLTMALEIRRAQGWTAWSCY